MNQTLRLLSWTLACSLLATSVNAAPRVPDPLAPWVTWVRDRTPLTKCPFFHGAKERQCRWPTRLKISLEKTGGTFSQTWQLYNAGLVPLPGNAKRWPLDVRADGKVIPVVGHAGRPQVMLTAGHHQITGRFRWDTLPQTLAVPAATGLVSLTVDGVGVPFPRRDAKGMLLLGTKHQSTGEAQRLDVIVHRKIRDEIPLEVTTRIKLDVAGVAREITLPQALLPNFAPLSLTSKLPARLGAKGRLRVQVRPGKWEILLRARQRRRNDKLTLPKPHLSKGDIGTGEEVWVFEPRPKLRLVEISGAAPVDPQQTSLFAPWKRFSTYRVAPGKTLILNERRRGEAGASLDQITLRRTLWLDFDGRGLTISDRLKGHLQRSTRLEALPQTKLGRVTADGRDQFITRHGPRVGVEVPRGPISVVAESRYEADPSLIPAVGWHHDVRSLSATLNLPPGWRLFLASGVDSAPGTWIGRWTLLDMFLVLVLGLAIARLFGWKVGALALIVLVLTFTEPGAPRWIWPFAIVLEALRRVLPRGWLHRILLVPHLSVALALILIGLPFCLQQVRQAIYPTLEHPEHRATNGSVYSQSGGFLSLARQAGESGDKTVRMTPSKPAGSQPQWLKSKQSHRGKRGNIYQSRLQNQQIQQLLDPNAVVQTGPGVPRWGWNTISLTWNGPVRQGEKIGLVLLSPTVNLIVGLLRAGLLLALLVLLIVIAQRRRPVTAGDGESGGDEDGDGSERAPTKPKPRDTPTPTPRPGQVAALILLGASLWTGNAYAQAPFPPTKLLDELGARLSKPAPCAPRCASISRLRLTLAGDVLRARVEIDAATLTAVPLPGRAQQWRPKTVIVDGTPATGLRRHGGHLWIALTTGRHEVHLAGPIGSATTIQLTLPLRPHRVEVQARAWRVDGINEDGLADETLTFTRKARNGTEGTKNLNRATGPKSARQPGDLPPFVRVTRRVVLGLAWHIETTVRRLTPKGSPVVLAIPLIPGELVTSERFRVRAGAVQVQLAPEQRQATWRSTLRRSPTLSLHAPKDGRWSEAWELVASPIWHVEARGLPRVHDAANSNQPPAWRPWPGEKLTFAISRPKGIGGQSLTLDKALLELRPGRRATDATLTINLRASRGGQHILTLPEGARVQKVTLGKTSYPVQQDGRRLTLPVSPGTTRITLVWRQAAALGSVYRVPALSLGSQAVNAQIVIRAPRSRWILLTGGARVGPVVLFWSLLALLLVVALVLARIPWTPLRTHHWLLLGVGLSQVPIWLSPLVAGWLIAIGWRERTPTWMGRWRFNLRQIALAVCTLPALIILFAAIYRGLLGHPDMQITGNASSASGLHWFVDRVGQAFPEPWIVSVPLWIYRLLMLLWSLWLAWSLVAWARWSWRAFKTGGLWRHAPVAPTAPQTTDETTAKPIVSASEATDASDNVEASKKTDAPEEKEKASTPDDPS